MLDREKFTKAAKAYGYSDQDLNDFFNVYNEAQSKLGIDPPLSNQMQDSMPNKSTYGPVYQPMVGNAFPAAPGKTSTPIPGPTPDQNINNAIGFVKTLVTPQQNAQNVKEIQQLQEKMRLQQADKRTPEERVRDELAKSSKANQKVVTESMRDRLIRLSREY